MNRDICCLRVLFRKAVERGWLDESPAQNLKQFKEVPNPPRLLSEHQVTKLLEVAPDHLKALFGTALYAGLRKEELFHLRWEDVDLGEGQLAVVSRREHTTKNNKTRHIPISDPLRELLQRHPRRLGSPYVFANRAGEAYDNIRGALATAAGQAGIEDLTMHQLRHAFCSHALMQNIDARTVQKWMGHQSLSTTLRYAHVSPDHEKAAIQRLRYDHGHYMDTGTATA